LQDIESSFPVVEASGISFQPPSEGAALSANLLDPTFDFVLHIETYYLEE